MRRRYLTFLKTQVLDRHGQFFEQGITRSDGGVEEMAMSPAQIKVLVKVLTLAHNIQWISIFFQCLSALFLHLL